MEKVLLLHSSREGQTIKILRYIEEKLGNVECEIKDLNSISSINLSKYDKVIIGASIRYGHFNIKLYQFIDSHLEQLNQSNAAFFCVNLTARKESEGKDTPEGSAYIKKFLIKSPWQPKLIGVFAGALYYPRYRWFDRVMIRFIMFLTGGETDTSKEVEYTNWEKVSLYVASIKKLNE